MKHVIFSGGLDSTTALALAVAEGAEVQALFFEYGQRHGGEHAAAVSIAKGLGVPLKVIDLTGKLHSRALLADSPLDVPKQAYGGENLGDTEVMGRNLLFASHAVAQAQRGDAIVLGVHGGDHELYPDCRPEFWEGFKALSLAYEVTTETPFLNLSKAGIVDQGLRVGAPLFESWSCYDRGPSQCGECATCRERREAFRLAGAEDFTQYLT